MVFGFESFGKKKELVPIDSERFKEMYGLIDESAFSENIRGIASDLKERMQSNPVNEERYIDTLQAIKGFLEMQGYSCDDLNAVENMVGDLMEEGINKEELQTYLSNSPLKGIN